MIAAILLLLAQVDLQERDLCQAAKSVLRAAPAKFQSVRGSAQKQGKGKTSFTEPMKLPLAASCKAVIYDDAGQQPFYGCEMHARSCKLTEKQFEKMRDELSGCLGKPAVRDEEKKRTARFVQRDGWYVRLVFNRAKACELMAFVEK